MTNKIETYMFDNYQNLDPNYIPNNTFSFLVDEEGVTDIIRGTTPKHFIIIPFKINNNVIKKLLITYSQGTYQVNKTLEDIKWKDFDEYCDIIYYSLTQTETLKFKPVINEKCDVQIKILLTNNDIYVSKPLHIKIKDVVSKEELLRDFK